MAVSRFVSAIAAVRRAKSEPARPCHSGSHTRDIEHSFGRNIGRRDGSVTGEGAARILANFLVPLASRPIHAVAESVNQEHRNTLVDGTQICGGAGSGFRRNAAKANDYARLMQVPPLCAKQEKIGRSRMSAYVLVDIEITDPAEYEEYRRLAYPVIAEFGGKYIVRGGTTEMLEGDWNLNRLVIVEFESLARAKESYHSVEYRPALDVIRKCGKRNLIIVEGL